MIRFWRDGHGTVDTGVGAMLRDASSLPDVDGAAASRMRATVLSRVAAAPAAANAGVLSPVLRTASAAGVAVLLMGGALGVSAAVGGPNVPAHVLSALDGDDDDEETDGTTNETDDPSITGSPVASGTASATIDADDLEDSPSLKGLCNAYFSGSPTGQGNKSSSSAFAALEDAAGGAAQVETFCAEALNEDPASDEETPGEDGRCNALERGSETGRTNKADAPAFADLDCVDEDAAGAATEPPNATTTPAATDDPDEPRGGPPPWARGGPPSGVGPQATSAEEGADEHGTPDGVGRPDHAGNANDN